MSLRLLNGEDAVEQAPASSPVEAPLPKLRPADLPDWLQGVDEESAAPIHEDGEATPWLRKETPESEEEPQLTPTSPSDWHPVEPKTEWPRKADLSSRPPMPKPKPSAAPPSREPVYEPLDGEWPLRTGC